MRTELGRTSSSLIIKYQTLADGRSNYLLMESCSSQDVTIPVVSHTAENQLKVTSELIGAIKPYSRSRAVSL